MTKETGGTVFPHEYFDQQLNLRRVMTGMTLRDYLAAKAMQANLQVIREFPDESWRMGLALDAYAMADAMLEARK